MGKYEALRDTSPVRVVENSNLPEGFKGLYVETDSKQIILLDKSLRFVKDSEKYCILAEEIGHFYTTAGDILDQTDIRKRKQEKRARNWAYERIVPLNLFVEAFRANVRNRFEFAEYIGVTEEFLDNSINHYLEVHGLSVRFSGYLISFDPLGVTKILL